MPLRWVCCSYLSFNPDRVPTSSTFHLISIITKIKKLLALSFQSRLEPPHLPHYSCLSARILPLRLFYTLYISICHSAASTWFLSCNVGSIRWLVATFLMDCSPSVFTSFLDIIH